MRLFTAIELAPDTKEAVIGQQARLAAEIRARGAAVRLTPPEQLHLTLLFIGQVDEARLKTIGELMTENIRQASFALTFGPVGVFPPRGRARILWLGVDRGERELIALQTEVVERLARAGVPREARPYHPHLTLGRWRDDEGPRGAVFAAAAVEAVERVTAVTLFESRLRPGGAEHMPLLRCALEAPPADPLH
jgi:2'-5' RNA ligase